jgi:DNA-binding NarL/FixJ family response regulator
MTPSDMAARPIRIVVAEDNLDLRAAMVGLIEAETDLQCVGEAADVVTVTALARSLSPDVVLLDFELGGESCIPLLEASLGRATAFIVFSGHANPKFIDLTIAAGARDYIVKNGNFDAVLASIRRHGRM